MQGAQGDGGGEGQQDGQALVEAFAYGQDGGDGGADAGDGAQREVDLAQQQDEDDADRDQAGAGDPLGDVGEVVGLQEVAGDALEDDRDEDEADDDGQ